MTTRFHWYELYTTDTEAAKKFYGDLVGWTTQAWEHAPDYTMWVAPGGGPVGGVMILPEQAKAMGAPPHWMGYVRVSSVADTTATAERLGGKVLMPPQELPNGARFALLMDPTGAAFGVHQSVDPEVPPRRALGEFSWAELMSSDPEAALAFYGSLFGWVKTDSMDMGPEMGTYQMFGHATDRSGTIGGMMKLPPGMPMSAWLFYANVPNAAEALDKVRAAGGKVLYGPQEVPGGGVIGSLIDPQGAAFAVYAEK